MSKLCGALAVGLLAATVLLLGLPGNAAKSGLRKRAAVTVAAYEGAHQQVAEEGNAQRAIWVAEK